MMSTDGVPVYGEMASFCFKLFNQIGNGSEFDDKLVFRGNPFTQG
jgi:hypothetical protein